jgi:hypothetical protein
MAFEALATPGEQIKHIGIFLTILGRFSEHLFLEVNVTGFLDPLVLALDTLHLEIYISECSIIASPSIIRIHRIQH